MQGKKSKIKIHKGNIYECKNYNDDKKYLDKRNKARVALGLKPIEIKEKKCLKCKRKIYSISRYRCQICDYYINEINPVEEVFERSKIFNCKNSRMAYEVKGD